MHIYWLQYAQEIVKFIDINNWMNFKQFKGDL